MDAYRCILSKRDFRTYVDRPIPDDVLQRILEAGRRSGSARNRQPWQFVVVTQKALMRRLAACGLFTRHLASAAAAIVVIVEAQRDLFDAGRCAQNLMLAAWSLGVASCPATLQRGGEVREALALPDGPVVATAISLGYAHPGGRGRIEHLALRVIAGRTRKPLSDLVHWNRFGVRSPWVEPLKRAAASSGAGPSSRTAPTAPSAVCGRR
jgi:nitroreductase